MMRFWIYVACCVLASGVFSKSIPGDEKRINLWKRSPQGQACCTVESPPPCCTSPPPEAVCCDDKDKDEDEEDDEPKRLVVYFNFQKVLKRGRIADKSGYENSGTMEPGGEILKFTDSGYTCDQAARLWEHDIILRGDTFQAKPKTAITIAAWIKLEEKNGLHSIFNTVGATHPQGQFNFEVNDGVVRWFHRDEKQKVVFEAMGHSVPRGKWSHVAGTYDSKTKQAKIFINGVIANQSLGEGLLSRDWGARAGIGDRQKNKCLGGSIDEFRIYNYALKPDEIKALVSACMAAQDEVSDGSLSLVDPISTGTDVGAGTTEGKNEGKIEEAKPTETGIEGKIDGKAEGKADGNIEGKIEGKTEGKAEGKADVNGEVPQQDMLAEVKHATSKLESGSSNVDNTAGAVVSEAPSPDPVVSPKDKRSVEMDNYSFYN